MSTGIIMNNCLVAVFLLLTDALLMTASPVHRDFRDPLLPSPRFDCSASFSPYCACEDNFGFRYLTCTVSTSDDFDSVRELLSNDPYAKDYGTVEFRMTTKLNIPKDILGGKRTQALNLIGPDSTTPMGEIDAEAFQSTYATDVAIANFDLTNHSFAFLSQFHIITGLTIYDSSLNQIKELPFFPELRSIRLQNTPGIESWYLPTQTPNLYLISITKSDLDDQEMDSILTSMTESFIYPNLNIIDFRENSLTQVPPLLFSFPSLNELNLYGNPIKTLTAGSINANSLMLGTLSLNSMQLTTIEPEAFIGDFSSTWIILSSNQITSFPSSVFEDLLKSMVNNTGYIYIYDNPIVNDCELAWLLVDNRDLLPHVDGRIANGTEFQDLDPTQYYSC